ncbi:MAG: tRNA lysidine(34) synthetase TilS [Gemmatimonadales bacterium]|nr:tRNA lysidine(34) synthetase TilS [Gemmatimonadales bacterium]
MALVEAFRTHLATLNLPASSALVAVSGGPDSVALLDLLVRTRQTHGLSLVVAHLDHGIHPDSASVADGVARLAVEFALPVERARADLGPSASETVARTARYEWLERARVRRGAALICTAHHADDQAETVLMRVLEGSGPAGLAGMSAWSGHLLRPLLPFRRAELAGHLAEVGLSAWADPANDDPRHQRSWIRAHLLPAIRDRLPRVDARLARVASQAARDRAGWDALIDVLPALDFRPEADGVSVAVSVLARYDSALSETLVAAVARRAGLTLGSARAARVVGLCCGGGSGALLQLGDRWIAELAFGRVRLTRPLERPAEPAPLAGLEGAQRWGAWQVRWRTEAAPARHPRLGGSAWFAPAPLVLRNWTAGERVRPLAGAGSRAVAKCFQEAGVPRSRRAGWPVVTHADQVVWVPGVCRSEALLPDEGTEALRVDAELA